MSSIHQLLRNYHVDGVFQTHVSMISPKGKFQLTKDVIEEFWIQYTKAIKNNEILGIAEKPGMFMPVVVDLDIKIASNDQIISESLYTLDQVKSVIEIYQTIIKKIVENFTDKQLMCILLEKQMYTVTKNDNTYFKHGFHLHFPYLFLSIADQEVYLIPKAKEMLNETKLFETLGFEKSGDLIDANSCKAPWLLYGSRKDETKQPYKITKIFDSNMNEINMFDALEHYQIYDYKQNPIKITKSNINDNIPRILSISLNNRQIFKVKPGIISPLKRSLLLKKNPTAPQVYTAQMISENLEVAKKLLPMLADFRRDDHNEWMRIGWSLYNISEGSQEGLDLWCGFSTKPSHDEGRCIFEWSRMIKKDITIGTIRRFASLDNPEEYNEFKKESAKKYKTQAVEGSHTDIAKMLYEYYGDEFVCSSVSNKQWYQFVNHKWELIEEGVFLRKKISEDIVSIFCEEVREIYSQLGLPTDKAVEKTLKERIKCAQRVVFNLKSAPYKRSVMAEAVDIFYDKYFKRKLNQNPWLICFQNGVYDLKNNVFRQGLPDDYISKCMPIDYINYSETDEKVHEVYDFLEKIFPDKSVRTYFMDTTSDVFVGGNTQKIVNFWTGCGDNGKTITQTLIENMLGPLAIKFPTTLITGKKPMSGAAFPDLARAGDGVRWGVLEEPDNDEMINSGTMKMLSGGDSFFARDLFEKGKDGNEIVPLFKLTFICNKLPKLKSSDQATWNRIRVIPFESTFCRENDPTLPETIEEQFLQKKFPMDKNFRLKIPGLLSAFAWVLLEHRKNIKFRVEPPKVRQATDLYRKQNDMYKQFYDEVIIEDSKHSLSLSELYNQFKDWFRESMPNHVVPIRSEVEEYFNKLFGEPDKHKKWIGYKIRSFSESNPLVDNNTNCEINKSESFNYPE